MTRGCIALAPATSASDMVVHLFNVLPREEVAQFARDITALLASYEGRLHNVDARSLLKDMGFEIGEA